MPVLKISRDDAAAIWRRVQQGGTYTALGKEYGVSPETIKKGLVRYGHIKPRITEGELSQIQSVMRELGRKLKKSDFEGQLSHLHIRILEQFGSVSMVNRQLWSAEWSRSKLRKCLICDREFVSQGSHHRTCQSDRCNRSRRPEGDVSWMGGHIRGVKIH